MSHNKRYILVNLESKSSTKRNETKYRKELQKFPNFGHLEAWQIGSFTIESDPAMTAYGCLGPTHKKSVSSSDNRERDNWRTRGPFKQIPLHENTSNTPKRLTKTTIQRIDYDEWSKLLKKSQGTLCPAGPVSIVQPSCCFALCNQALNFIELPVKDVVSQSFNVSLAVHYFVKNLLWRKC
jgi:hypothetical protein